jgi:hypothetical protein
MPEAISCRTVSVSFFEPQIKFSQHGTMLSRNKLFITALWASSTVIMETGRRNYLKSMRTHRGAIHQCTHILRFPRFKRPRVRRRALRVTREPSRNRCFKTIQPISLKLRPPRPHTLADYQCNYVGACQLPSQNTPIISRSSSRIVRKKHFLF